MRVPSLGQHREGGVFCQVLLVQRQKLNCYPLFPPSLGARREASPLGHSLAETLRVEQTLRVELRKRKRKCKAAGSHRLLDRHSLTFEDKRLMPILSHEDGIISREDGTRGLTARSGDQTEAGMGGIISNLGS